VDAAGADPLFLADPHGAVMVTEPVRKATVCEGSA
jgi:hypothetical protein